MNQLIRNSRLFLITICLGASTLVSAKLKSKGGQHPKGPEKVLPTTTITPTLPPPTPTVMLSSPKSSPMGVKPMTLLPTPKSRIALFGEIGGGGSWKDHPTSINRNLNPPAVYNSSLPQGEVSGGIGVAGLVYDDCAPSLSKNCTHVWLRGQVGGGYWTNNQASYLQLLAGVEINWMWEKHPAIALRFTADLGYGRLFVGNDRLSATDSFTWSLDESALNCFLLQAGPGLIIRFDPWLSQKGLALTLDARFYYAGGEAGFTIPIGIRYRI